MLMMFKDVQQKWNSAVTVAKMHQSCLDYTDASTGAELHNKISIT